MAQKDGLTGLYNKMTTEALIDRLLAEHQCEAGALAMIMLDIDNFKELNDSLGHVAGDRIIQEFAQSLRTAFAPTIWWAASVVMNLLFLRASKAVMH